MCDFSRYGGASDEWLAVEATLPAADDASKSSVNARREAMSAEQFKPMASQLRVKDYSIPTRDGECIEARTYRPTSVDEDAILPVYIHLHGGGYYFGTIASEDALCGRIALGAGVTVLNVNYRHTPEYRYPTPFNDAEDAFEWAHDQIGTGELRGDPHKIVVGGISAGAHFAASITLRKHLGEFAASRPALAGQVLMIACVVHMDCYGPQLAKMADASISSYRENVDAPLLSVKTCKWFTDMLQIKDPRAEGLRLSPGNASPEQVKGMPPTVFAITGLDPLRDESLLYAKMLTEAGVPTDINMFKGLPHGFTAFRQLSAIARWNKVMEDGIKWAVGNPAPLYKFDVKEE